MSSPIITELDAADPRLGSVLAERYRLHSLLGEGGMGKVYAAEHVLMKKRLAVKVLHRELTLVPEVVARFEREAMAAANIDHPNVAAATDFGRLADGSVFLVLEFVQGRSLREEIAKGPMAVERALHIARQIGSGLRGAHVHGIVHRDLKPENVMLVEKEGDPDFVKVLDFGVAKVPIGEMPTQGTPISRAGMVFGTPEYMAPEQALGEPVDGRADLYALGVMLFEMLAGERPFLSESPVGILGQQLSQSPPRFADRIGPGVVPPVVERAVHRLLARDRHQRPATAREVEDQLSSLLVPSPSASGTRFTLSTGTPAANAEFDLPPSSQGRHARPSEATHSSLPPEPESRFGALGDWFSALPPRAAAFRERLPSGLRDSLRPVPPRALAAAGLVGVGVVAVLALAVVIVLGRSLFSPGAEQPVAPAQSAVARASAAGPASAPPATLPAAPSDTTALNRPPAGVGTGEGEALVQSAWAESRKENYATALSLASRALARDPARAADDRLSMVVFAAARRTATANAAFDLLDGPMGGRGAELIWDLASDAETPARVRQRAGRWLRSPSFRRMASPALSLAADLRTARSCEHARELLTKAKTVGDERSLTQLEAWQVRTGCGKKQQEDCMPCLRGDVRLEEAIAAIRARPAPPWKTP
jgi:serine/threonine protein kinase